MRKCIYTLGLLMLGMGLAVAQDTEEGPKPKKKDWSKVTLGDRPNDHLLIQLGYDGWSGTPDSIRTTGIGRHFNVYFMLDKPFKTDPRWSVGLGVGIGSSNIFFDKMTVDLAGAVNRTQVSFIDAAEANHFNKYKLTNVWAEIPVELRHVANPLNSGKSFKWSVGAKVGTMIAGYTRGKDFQNKDGQSLYGKKYSLKEKDRKFLNNLRLAPTVRVGFGHFTLYGAYQLTSLFREGQGPEVRPFSVGLCIGGL
ncbi:MAG TPA: hypothetical protein VK907_03375 [Phnomibacter sp.]|nr:hypothetical protein [Phnomibacter sp.]